MSGHLSLYSDNEIGMNEIEKRSEKPVLGVELLEVYRQMLASLFVATLCLIAIVGVPLIVLEVLNRRMTGDNRYDLPILAFVALSGALGAFFSALMRLYSLEQLPAALVNVALRQLSRRYLIMYSLIPPITGMIGAVAFYLAIASGLIQGDLFQRFKCVAAQGACDSVAGLLAFSPSEATDYAKSLVWGFVAGFSERLVPDALGRLGRTEHSPR